MACGCRKKRVDFNRVKRLATVFAKANGIDVQIFKEEVTDLDNIKFLYNFEPVNPNRDNIIEIIKCQE